MTVFDCPRYKFKQLPEDAEWQTPILPDFRYSGFKGISFIKNSVHAVDMATGYFIGQ